MKHYSSAQGTILYDGQCGICQAFIGFLMKKDDSHKFRGIPYQMAKLNKISPGLTVKMARKTIYFVDTEGRRFGGAKGVFEMLKRLPGLWGVFGSVMSFAPLSILSEPFYQIFASNRHHISRTVGFRECSSTTMGM